MKISGCIIAKNEEKNIRKCISSYIDIVDEVIVVDTGSEDGTIQAAREMGAKVYNYEWNNDFAKAKNFAISMAKGDWIIFLDADEYFAEGHSRNVKQYIEQIHYSKQFDGICCRMANIQKETGEVINYIIQIRIFRNLPSIRYQNNIHECIYKDGNKLSVFFAEKEDILIYHTGYSSSVGTVKAERNLKLLLEAIKQEGCPACFNGYISDSYFVMKQWDKSIEYAQKYIDSGVSMTGYDIKPHMNIVESMVNRQDSKEKILETACSFIDKFKDNPTFYLYAAEILFSLKRYTEAFNFYKTAYDLNTRYKGLEINLAQTAVYNIQHKLGQIYYLSNDYENAFCCLVESLKEKKYNFQPFCSLYMLVKNNTLDEKVTLFNSLYDIENKDDVGFLTKALAVLKGRDLLAYYEGIWLKKYNQNDLIVAYTLYANNIYNEAFRKFMEVYRITPSKDDEIRSICAASCILTNDNNNFVDNMNDFEEEDKKVLELFFGEDVINSGIKIPEKYSKSYLTVLKQMINTASGDVLDRYLSVAGLFEKSIWMDIFNILLDNWMFATALDLCSYLHELKLQGTDVGVDEEDLIFNAGLCYFKLERYEDAKEFFSMAKDKGYKGNDLNDFMVWTDLYLKNMICI